MKINLSLILGIIFNRTVKRDQAEEDQKEEKKYTLGIEDTKRLKQKKENLYSHCNSAFLEKQ